MSSNDWKQPAQSWTWRALSLNQGVQFVAVWYWWVRLHDKVLSKVRIHEDKDGMQVVQYGRLVSREKALKLKQKEAKEAKAKKAARQAE
jgi:hypothetical protein